MSVSYGVGGGGKVLFSIQLIIKLWNFLLQDIVNTEMVHEFMKQLKTYEDVLDSNL